MPEDYAFSGFYYEEQERAGLDRLGRTLPELTERDPRDPLLRLLRVAWWQTHGQAVRTDHVARNLYPGTFTTRGAAIELARLVGFQLEPAAPAEATVLADLAGAVGAGAEVVQARTVWSTAGGNGSAPIEFETEDAYSLDAGTGTYTLVELDGVDLELLGETPTVVGAIWGAYGAGDALLIGHRGAMFNRVALSLPGPVTGGVPTVRWEYLEPGASGTPDAVTDNGATITLDVSTLAGISTAADGLQVTVRCLRTGVAETRPVVTAAGRATVTTTGVLGQSAVSTRPADYVAITDWRELEDVEDGTVGLTQAGDVAWALPQGATKAWTRTALTMTAGGAAGTEVDAFWVRARVVALNGSAAPTQVGVATEPDGTTWTVALEAQQGRTVQERLGTSDGSSGQRYPLTLAPFLSLTELTVDAVGWSIVPDLLGSLPQDRHAVLDLLADGTYRVRFGDGNQGAIPADGAALVATYRIGGDVSGNVGAGEIRRDRTGNQRLRNVRNPRPAAGWVEAEGSTEAGLERVRERIPAEARASDRVVTPGDVELFATTFRTADGSRLAVRAVALESGSGPQTVRVVCVGPGGAVPTAADLAELEVALNGTRVGLQRVGGVMVNGQRATGEAYVPRAVDVTVTVNVLSSRVPNAAARAAAEARITAALEAMLQPDARALELQEDGTWDVSDTAYQWEFLGNVDPSVLSARVIGAQPGVSSVAVTSPAAPIALVGAELPVPGTINVTVVAV